jgi:hypothetical protein
MQSPADAARAVEEVFSESFDTAEFTLESCLGVGQRIFEALATAGLFAVRRSS